MARSETRKQLNKMLSNRSFVFAVVFVALCIGFSSAETSVGECVICDSTKDANCAVDPSKIAPQKCSTQENTCYTRIHDGVTYRGCLKELDEGIQKNCSSDGMGQYCFICENVNTNKGCNNFVFPSHRLTCHSCSGGLNSACFNVPSDPPLPCKIYNVEDSCYTYKTAKTIERGCLSDTSKCSNVSHCSICTGEGCNNEKGSSDKIPTAPSSAAHLAATFSVAIVMFVSLSLIS
ncbi:uncharacterized protein LOC116350598 [Contarinia nasturtii]|uniref:uncharacterized protein LOC116350598 n=1 Tax=Contarinia nasturtii TaxID=265458 RepID=UPI0012D400FC|nr:uncharacterized protein LOC116350598 [Contarinia nasturtii]